MKKKRNKYVVHWSIGFCHHSSHQIMDSTQGVSRLYLLALLCSRLSVESVYTIN